MTKNKEEKLNKRFIASCDIAFEPRLHDEMDFDYWDNVIRPEREIENDRNWETRMANSD